MGLATNSAATTTKKTLPLCRYWSTRSPLRAIFGRSLTIIIFREKALRLFKHTTKILDTSQITTHAREMKMFTVLPKNMKRRQQCVKLLKHDHSSSLPNAASAECRSPSDYNILIEALATKRILRSRSNVSSGNSSPKAARLCFRDI